MQLSTKLDRMPASDVGDVIDELNTRVRTLHLGPVKAAQFLRKNVIGENADARQSSIERVGHSGIQSILVQDVRTVVAGESRLVQAVVAKTSFIHPMCGRHIGPVLSKNLGAGVDLGKPSALQLAGVGNCAGVVAEEIHAAERVALVQVVIHFPDRIVGAHHIGEAEINRVTRNRCWD